MTPVFVWLAHTHGQPSPRNAALNKYTFCLLLSACITRAAAAMSVRVGQLADPIRIPGLAHFLEHVRKL